MKADLFLSCCFPIWQRDRDNAVSRQSLHWFRVTTVDIDDFTLARLCVHSRNFNCVLLYFYVRWGAKEMEVLQPLVQRLIMSLVLALPSDAYVLSFIDGSVTIAPCLCWDASFCLLDALDTLVSVLFAAYFLLVAACYNRSRQLWLWLLHISSYTFLVERVRWR
jgi:hypothetical protein